MTCSAWHIWHIRIRFLNEPMRQIAQTVKARSKDEAERKAGEYLAGRGMMVYEVIMQNRRASRSERSDVAVNALVGRTVTQRSTDIKLTGIDSKLIEEHRTEK